MTVTHEPPNRMRINPTFGAPHFPRIKAGFVPNTVLKMDLSLVPLHHNKQYMEQCCDLVNSEWNRSNTARMHSLSASCDNFPTHLILLQQDKVIGHAKLSRIPSISHGCFVESVVIDKPLRGQGFGRQLMDKVEEYCRDCLQLKTVYLSTHDQEGFYTRLGYVECGSISIYGSYAPNMNPTSTVKNVDVAKSVCEAPKPPPMLPIRITTSNKTCMMKHLKLPV